MESLRILLRLFERGNENHAYNNHNREVKADRRSTSPSGDSLLKRFRRENALRADEVLNSCKDLIDRSSQCFTASSSGEYLTNRHQCTLLIRRLSETQHTLADFPNSKFLDDKAVPVLQELQQALVDAEALITNSCSIATSSEWLRAIIEQGDMKETFSQTLYDVSWCTNLLFSMLMKRLTNSEIDEFQPASCERTANMTDEVALLIAAKEDEESLRKQLQSTQLKDPTERRLGDKLLKLLNVASQRELSDATEPRFPGTSSLLLHVEADEIVDKGHVLGSSLYAEVKSITWLGREYAAKIFNKLVEEESNGKPLYEREIEALEGLRRHPYIVRLFCHSVSKEKLYLVMEKMNMDLHEFLKSRSSQPFSHAQEVDLMLQIAEGMRYIHNKGMAHRDLKSGNILVNTLVNDVDPESPNSSSSRICVLRITDFGLTKTTGSNQTRSNHTVNTGTRKWMAPEVMSLFRDNPQYSKWNPRKIDVFSFAVICSEILTRAEPYDDLRIPGRSFDFNTLVKEVKAGTMRPTLPNDCPQMLKTLIRRCWDGNPYKRPSFPEICTELRYIKGLLLRGELEKVQSSLQPQSNDSMQAAYVEGPWGGTGGGPFYDRATSIKRIKVNYFQASGIISQLEVEYEDLGRTFVKKYCDGGVNADECETINLEPFEFITQISGFTNEHSLSVGGKPVSRTLVVSLTIHTNLKAYGPFGEATSAKSFRSSSGTVVGFHGSAGILIDRIGVVITPLRVHSQ